MYSNKTKIFAERNTQQCSAIFTMLSNLSKTLQCSATCDNVEQSSAKRDNAQQYATMLSNLQQCSAIHKNTQQYATMLSDAYSAQ